VLSSVVIVTLSRNSHPLIYYLFLKEDEGRNMRPLY